jgi:hypothetical protein
MRVWSSASGAGSRGRQAAWAARTPRYNTRLIRKRGVRAASRSSSSSGPNNRCVVPSAHRCRSSCRTCPVSVRRTPSSATGGRSAYRRRPFEPCPVVSRNHHARVEIEAAAPRMTRPRLARHGQGRQVGRAAALAHGGAGPRPECDTPLHGGGGGRGRQDRLPLGPRIHRLWRRGSRGRPRICASGPGPCRCASRRCRCANAQPAGLQILLTRQRAARVGERHDAVHPHGRAFAVWRSGRHRGRRGIDRALSRSAASRTRGRNLISSTSRTRARAVRWRTRLPPQAPMACISQCASIAPRCAVEAAAHVRCEADVVACRIREAAKAVDESPFRLLVRATSSPTARRQVFARSEGSLLKGGCDSCAVPGRRRKQVLRSLRSLACLAEARWRSQRAKAGGPDRDRTWPAPVMRGAIVDDANQRLGTH